VITDAGIRAATRRAKERGKAVELKDEGLRGEGRLALIVRIVGDRPTAEWFAVWWRDQRRKTAKLGTYPALGVAAARKTFREDYLPKISAGEDPAGPRARRDRLGVTLRDLFEAYVDDLKAKGKPSWKNVERILLGLGEKRDGGAAKAIGASKRACDVTPEDVRDFLADIHGRGAIAMAAETRAYISAAFNHGLRSANSYTSSAGRKWGLSFNPVATIPADPEARRVGNRHLTPAEFRMFWRWLEGQDEVSLGAPVLRLMMATGSRLTEILRISAASYDRAEKLVTWSKTKNGLPHAIPLPPQAVTILDGLLVNAHGMYFPHEERPDEPMTIEACEKLTRRFLTTAKIPHFTPRDLRRTWKTLAGAAGVSKEVRDRLQNHALQDVSSKSYDRWNYLPEKRAGMNTWGDYLERILAGELDNPVTRLQIGGESGVRGQP